MVGAAGDAARMVQQDMGLESHSGESRAKRTWEDRFEYCIQQLRREKNMVEIREERRSLFFPVEINVGI